MHRTALLLMVGSGILLTAGNGTDAYPIVGYSQAVAASEDSTGILLEQSVQGLVPLLGYGDIRETRTQPPEDESTWHTLTTEELLGADGILPQSSGKETQEVAEPAESTSPQQPAENLFRPADRCRLTCTVKGLRIAGRKFLCNRCQYHDRKRSTIRG